MWLARVITLVLVLRHSNENHSINKADILQRLHWFLREMTSEKQVQKLYTDDVTI